MTYFKEKFRFNRQKFLMTFFSRPLCLCLSQMSEISNQNIQIRSIPFLTTSISPPEINPENFFEVASYFAYHPKTVVLDSKYWGTNAWAVPHLRLWGRPPPQTLGDRPPSLP